MPRPDPMTEDQRSTRGKIAAGRRHHPDDPATEKMAAEFKADRAAQYIQRLVDSAPQLSAEQCARLAVLLHAAGVSR